MDQLKSRSSQQQQQQQHSRRHANAKGGKSSSNNSQQQQPAYPPNASPVIEFESPTPVTSSTPTRAQYPQQQTGSLGASFDLSRAAAAAAAQRGGSSNMTSGLNSTLMMASNAQAASASMPLLKKAAIKPSVAVKIGQKYTKLFEQIRAIELLYSSLYTQVDLYHVRSAVLRNTGDEVALMFAMLARVSGPTFKTSLEQVARSVGIVQDYRHAEILRLKGKVLDTLGKYGPKLTQIKNEMKRLEKAIIEEQKARGAYNKKLAGTNAPLAVEKARAAHQVKLGIVEQQKKSFDAMISEFEKSRLETLKTFMKDFLHLEMLFHAKVLDFYTAAYKSIDDMHPEIDFADFKRVFLENAIDAPMGLQGTQAFGATTSSSALGATTGLSTMSSTGTTNGAGFGASGSGLPLSAGASGAARVPVAGPPGTTDLYDDEYTDEDGDELDVEDLDDSAAPPTASSLYSGANSGPGMRMGPATVPPGGARPPGQAAFNGSSTSSSMNVPTATTNRTNYY